VAYQKTDGSWVTNVPADAGVSNTASANVTGTCGGETPNPMVSASLQISGQACVGGVLSAKFTITNRGNAAITLSRLSAGGRLNNDNTGAGGFPDFPFANNITLNPGASFNYTGSQTLTRTGSYSFFVAYQKTDGSWVTNVPADAGVTNTAGVSVTGTCGGGGTPNPMVSGSLTISPNGPYFTGVTLTARFTITNRGNAAITFSRLGAGGRLNNDNSCSGGCPDFSFDTNVTLNAGASYSYTGTQFISRAGSYGFYVAYQKTDGTWVTNVPADAGVTNTVNINVGTQTQTIAWEFSSTGNSQGWTGNNMSATSVNSGIYFLDPSGLDPFIVSPNISASASTYQYFVVQMASNGLDSTGAVYFKTQAENFYSEDKKVLFTVSNCSLCGNAGFVRYAVFMAGNSKWTGTITGLRLDPTGKGQSGTNTDSIGIDYIRLSSSSLASNSLLEVFEHVAISNRYFYPLATPAICQSIYGASGPDGPLACAGE
jgi:nitrogen fixation protein FixH